MPRTRSKRPLILPQSHVRTTIAPLTPEQRLAIYDTVKANFNTLHNIVTALGFPTKENPINFFVCQHGCGIRVYEITSEHAQSLGHHKGTSMGYCPISFDHQHSWPQNQPLSHPTTPTSPQPLTAPESATPPTPTTLLSVHEGTMTLNLLKKGITIHA